MAKKKKNITVQAAAPAESLSQPLAAGPVAPDPNPDTVRFPRRKIIAGAVDILVFLLIFWVGFYTGVVRVSGNNSLQGVLVAAGFATPPPPPGRTFDTAALVPEGYSPEAVAPVWSHGDPNSPVQMAIFVDYECPFSAMHIGENLQGLLDNPDVYLTIHDFPLDFHPNALPAARIGRLIGQQYPDQYPAYLSGVAAQLNGGGVLQQDILVQLAVGLGIPEPEVLAALETDYPEIALDMANGQAMGINGTPGTVLNGRLLSGYFPPEDLKAQIDLALAEAQKAP